MHIMSILSRKGYIMSILSWKSYIMHFMSILSRKIYIMHFLSLWIFGKGILRLHCTLYIHFVKKNLHYAHYVPLDMRKRHLKITLCTLCPFCQEKVTLCTLCPFCQEKVTLCTLCPFCQEKLTLCTLCSFGYGEKAS